MSDKNLIKVIDPKLAEELKALGFSYMKENDVFVFVANQELLSVINTNYCRDAFVLDNKLCFS